MPVSDPAPIDDASHGSPLDIDLGTDHMLARKGDGVGWMIYNNPARHNAMSMSMQLAVPKIIDAFADDPDIRVVVVTGAGGKAFVSGADISEFEEKRTSVEARAEYDAAGAAAGTAMAHLDKPTIAMIRGYCIGGGMLTALRCDLRYASEHSRFAIPAARLGLGYGYAGVSALVDLVGRAHAAEMLFSARQYDSGEALHIGLVNRVLPEDGLTEAVLGVAGRIAANAPLTVRATKFAIEQAVRDRQDRDMDRVEALVEECFLSEDYAEGRRAFMDKRPPVFRGR